MSSTTTASSRPPWVLILRSTLHTASFLVACRRVTKDFRRTWLAFVPVPRWMLPVEGCRPSREKLVNSLPLEQGLPSSTSRCEKGIRWGAVPRSKGRKARRPSPPYVQFVCSMFPADVQSNYVGLVVECRVASTGRPSV